jgi:hypothetical protein
MIDDSGEIHILFKTNQNVVYDCCEKKKEKTKFCIIKKNKKYFM